MIEAENLDWPEARVLVAVINRSVDLAFVLQAGWYRIPLANAPSRLAADYLALYQTGRFGREGHCIRWYAPIVRYSLATRRELLPLESSHPRAQERYHRLDLGPLQSLDPPLPARRLRRITFIATSLGQLMLARDVRELFHPPEDRLPPSDLWGAGLNG